MDGHVRLFDSLDGRLCGDFDAGHRDQIPDVDGEVAMYMQNAT